MYDIENSRMTRTGRPVEAPVETCACEAKADVADGVTLFATTTCPNCKIAAAALEKAGVAYTKIYANEQPDAAEAFGIRQAPTLVVVKDGVVEKYAGVSDIKKFLAQ